MPPERALARDVVPPAPAVRPAAGRARRGRAEAPAADASSRAARAIDGARANLATLRAAPAGAAPEPLALALLVDHLRTARRWVAIAREPALAFELDGVHLAARAFAIEGAARSAPRRGGPPAAQAGGGRSGDELFALLAGGAPAIDADDVELAGDAIDAFEPDDLLGDAVGGGLGVVGGVLGVGASAAKAADAPNRVAAGFHAATLGVKATGLAVDVGQIAASAIGDGAAVAGFEALGKGLGTAAAIGEGAADLATVFDGGVPTGDRIAAGLSAACNAATVWKPEVGLGCKLAAKAGGAALDGIHDTSRAIVDGAMGDAFQALTRRQRQIGGLDAELRRAGIAAATATDPAALADAAEGERRACAALGGAIDALLDDGLAQPALGGRSSTPGCYGVLVDRLAPLQALRGRRAPGPLLEAAAIVTATLATCLDEQERLAEDEMLRGRGHHRLVDGPKVRAAVGA